MSTSTGKPFNPSNPLQRDAEHGDAERRGGEDPTVRSPYAPKRVRGGFIAPVRADDQVPAPPRFLLDTKGSGRGLTDFSDTSLRFGDEAFDEGEWPADERDHRGSGQRQHAMPGDDHHATETHSPERGTADRRPAPTDEEEELRRLEESVRVLQNASRATRSPEHAAPAARGGDTTMQQRRRGETLGNGYRAPPSLQPQVLSAPPGLGNGGNAWMRTVLAVSAAVVIAAPIAYYLSSGSSNNESPSDTQLTPVPVATTPVTPGTWGRAGGSAEETTSPVTVVPKKVVTRLSDPPASAMPSAREPAPVSESFPPVARVAPPPPARVAPPPPARVEPPPPARVEPPPVARVAPPPLPTRVLAPAEIELLVKQGQEFAAAGDFVTARVVFQRAAEAGNAVAALAMGASYDPAVLAGLGARGVDADVNKARSWYQRAKDLGLAEASRRLDLLANR